MKKTIHSKEDIPSGVQTSLEELLRLKGKARGFSFLPRQPVTSLLAGRHASRLRGRGLDFEELRHYQQGDDIRTMDWLKQCRKDLNPENKVLAKKLIRYWKVPRQGFSWSTNPLLRKDT